MRCLTIQTDDPYFCLAAEEYLLRSRTENFFLLWKSKPAVIVGKHQNTLAEISARFIRDEHILVARRLSGGGAVYHDPGNLNFSFITNEEPGRLIDFKRFALPLCEFLEKTGIPASPGPKNDIRVNGMKISGNAGHVYKNRVLHHGTLLFDTDLQQLSSSLSENAESYPSRAVQSNRAKVANISDFLPEPMGMDAFSKRLMHYIKDRYKGERYDLNGEETEQIRRLAGEKYAQWDWIYGYSPEYRFEKEFYHNGRAVRMALTVEKGLITDCIMETDLVSADILNRISAALKGCRHAWEDLLPMAEQLEWLGIPEEKREDFIIDNLF